MEDREFTPEQYAKLIKVNAQCIAAWPIQEDKVAMWKKDVLLAIQYAKDCSEDDAKMILQKIIDSYSGT